MLLYYNDTHASIEWLRHAWNMVVGNRCASDCVGSFRKDQEQARRDVSSVFTAVFANAV